MAFLTGDRFRNKIGSTVIKSPDFLFTVHWETILLPADNSIMFLQGDVSQVQSALSAGKEQCSYNLTTAYKCPVLSCIWCDDLKSVLKLDGFRGGS